MRMRWAVVACLLVVLTAVDVWVFTAMKRRREAKDEAASAATVYTPRKASAAKSPSMPMSREAVQPPTSGPRESAQTSPTPVPSASLQPVRLPAAQTQLVPLVLRLPDKAFTGTPKDIQLSSYVEPLSDKPRAPFMVPPGLTNLASGLQPTSSDRNANPESLQKLTDGDKSAGDDSIVFLRKGTQWVQLDLREPCEVFAILLWHAHNSAKVYHDIIVLGAEQEDFTTNVRSLYNNDQDNSSGLGIGSDREYFETHEGRLIDARGATLRYLRFYSRGSTESALNEYTEIEVYGRRIRQEHGQ